MVEINLLDLYAKISLDSSEYDKGIDDASEKGTSFADKLKSGFVSAAKYTAAAVGAASTAVAALTKSAVQGYADYEQLVGGVETLFKGSANIILDYADNAYKTAGLSANQYMETVTSFSASLLQSLGNDTEAAAGYADLAITDMADNANKMGTNIESIQNAYQGFAKQNYTMLDNLKLGYGGTKQEMERLIADANSVKKANGEMANLSIESFADIVEAIHIVQGEMDITGTTAKEASETISGSLSAAKAAWSNLVVGVASENANLDGLIGNFVESVFTVGKNVLPVVDRVLGGIGQMVQSFAPIISEQLPVLISSVLPTLLQSGVKLIEGIGSGLLSALPTIATAALEVILTLASGLGSNLPQMVPAIVSIVLQIVQTLLDNLPQILTAGLQIILGMARGIIQSIPQLVSQLPQIITALVSFLVGSVPQIAQAGFQLFVSLIKNLPSIIASIVQAVPQIIAGIGSAFLQGVSQLGNIGNTLFSSVWSKIKSAFRIGDALQWGKDLLQNFINGIGQMISSLVNKVKSVANTVKSYLGFSEPEKGPLSNFHTYAPDMMKLFAQGIKENEGLVTDQLEKSFDFQPQIAATVGDIPTASYAGTSAGGSGGVVIEGGIHISVEGSKLEGSKSDELRALARELAAYVGEELQYMTGRRQNAYA